MAAVQTAPKRTEYLNFWNKYSDRPSYESMLLNNNAHELEELDRADVVRSLPDYTDKDVADIGAGIGRFTTLFSQKAKKVISTDFIENFINKNKERNAAAKNVEFVVSDAASLDLENSSLDLVFTNWLFMYLSDSECVDFTLKALRWLRPGGYFKLRESCSEPSTGRRKGNTVHITDAANPTHYRFKSLYLLLLTHARYQSPDGTWFKFDVEWGTSIPTYITLANNWRQVHWLARKVPTDAPTTETVAASREALLKAFATTWPAEQIAFDALVDGNHVSWTHKIMAPQVSASLGATILGYSPRIIDPTAAVDTFALVDETTTTNFWTVEPNALAFRASNTKATEKRDQRQRFAWHKNLQSAVTYLTAHDVSFEGVIATELLATATNDELANLKSVLTTKASIVLLEPSLTGINTEALTNAGFVVESVEDVTTAAHASINEQVADGNVVTDVVEKSLKTSWFLIKAVRP